MALLLRRDGSAAIERREGSVTTGAFEGIVGLGVGAGLNRHLTNLDVTRRLARPRRALAQ